MIRSIYIPAHAALQNNLSTDDLKTALQKDDGLLWVSLENPDPEEFLILRDVFHFHPLAIEDCQSTGYQAPKVDDFETYLFLIVHALQKDHNLDELDTRELNLFLAQNYLVTVYLGEPLHPIQTVFTRVQRDERLWHNGADFLCHAVLDTLVDEYMPVIDQMDEEIESLEDRVLSHPDPHTMERIINLKHSIMALRRIVSPMREVINRLSRDEFPMIDQRSQIYFRDVYDHLVRLQDLSDSIRDIVSGAMDIYLNSTSLRLNEVMKALTIVSTIFLPLSFIAGVYGMNFTTTWPPLDWKYGIHFFWGICFAVTAGMLIWFKRRRWF